MNKTEHYETAPEDRIPFALKLVYGFGAFVNNLLGAASGGMMIVLNIGLGMNPALVGLLGAIPRLTDAFTDPLMGYISDNTKSKWGRRRPYIFVGAIATGITFALLWQLPKEQSESYYFAYFLGMSFLFYAAYTVFATPWVALGYELTPDYHERTRLMGVQNAFGQLSFVVAPWFLWIMKNEDWFPDEVDGAGGLAAVIAVLTICIGVLPAIFLRERIVGPVSGLPVAEIANQNLKEKKKKKKNSFADSMKAFFKGFGISLKSKPFALLCVAAFLVFNGFQLIASFGSYVIIYFVCGGDEALGAKYVGLAGSVGAASGFVIVVLVTWLGTKIGKRRAFFVSTGVSMVGYGLKWWCYNPDYPLLTVVPAPLMAFGLTGLFTLIPSMIADTVDLDELSTEQRREGMYGAIFWWVIKLGLAAALAGSGYLLNATGFDIELARNQTAEALTMMRLFDAVIPIATSAVAIWCVAKFPITEAYARRVREELELRRGKAEVVADAGP